MAFVKISEQPSLYDDLEKKSVHELLVDINTEDKKVALAVEKALPQMEDLVTRIVPRMKKGGRVFYMAPADVMKLGKNGLNNNIKEMRNNPQWVDEAHKNTSTKKQ